MRRRTPTRPSKSYEVGKGRPPRATRWKPGQSGNPKGRPKGSRPIGAVLQAILGQRIAVTENGKTRLLPALEVMLRRLANDAMRNEPGRLDEILAEDKAILANFLKQPSDDSG
jgi:Family of unknown function (DUF5681)